MNIFRYAFVCTAALAACFAVHAVRALICAGLSPVGLPAHGTVSINVFTVPLTPSDAAPTSLSLPATDS